MAANRALTHDLLTRFRELDERIVFERYLDGLCGFHDILSIVCHIEKSTTRLLGQIDGRTSDGLFCQPKHEVVRVLREDL